MKCHCSASNNEALAIVKTAEGKVIAYGHLRLGINHGGGSFHPIGRLFFVGPLPEVSVEVTQPEGSDKKKFSLHTHRLRNWRLISDNNRTDGETANGDEYRFDSEVV